MSLLCEGTNVLFPLSGPRGNGHKSCIQNGIKQICVVYSGKGKWQIIGEHFFNRQRYKLSEFNFLTGLKHPT